MSVFTAKKTQSRIWARIINPDHGDLAPAAAEFMRELIAEGVFPPAES
jgi:hypothetical protein